MIQSGRCHGPGCQREARVEFFCGEPCQAAWEKECWRPEQSPTQSATGWSSARAEVLARSSCDCSVHPVTEHAASPTRIRIDILGDSAERFRGPSPAFREAIRNLGSSMGGAAAIAAGGIGQALAHSAEVERLTLHLRMACPPDRFDGAMAEVEDLMATTWMPRTEALQRVLAEGRFLSADATKPLVASPSPQVAQSGQEPRWRRWLHRMRRTR
jgi:hypothetical protein